MAEETTQRESSRKIRVLLADDHPVVRTGIRNILEAEQDVVVVGEATDGHEAQRMSRELRPDVLLLDLNMPGPRPLETMAYLRERCPEVKVLVLTAYDDDAYVRSLPAAGVAGYVLKDEATEAVLDALHTVVGGGTWFSRPVVEKLARLEKQQTLLTAREWEILGLIAQGYDNARIAAELSLAEQTIRNYVSRIYTKLAVDSRAEAIVWAREYGIGAA